MNTRSPSALLILLVAAATLAAYCAAPATAVSAVESTKYIVTLDRFDAHGDRRRAMRQNARENLLAELTARSSRAKQSKSSRTSSADDSVFEAVVTNEFTTILNGFAGRFSKAALKFMRDHPDVKSVELDPKMKAISDQPSTLLAQKRKPQWGLDRIDQAALPLDKNYDYEAPACASTDEGCHGVRLYVVDTGVYGKHNDFRGRMRRGYDFHDNDSNPQDCHGHGTHCASTAAGKRWGVAKHVADIVPLRVLDCQGYGEVSTMISAVEWALLDAQEAGVRGVASISLGFSTWPEAGEEAINNSVDAGLIVVAAAGNESGDACLSFPAVARNAITVGSTTRDDDMSSFSNFGSCVDIFAPGSDIRAAGHQNPNANTVMSGTSMATPHVAGVAARTLALYPTATSEEILTAMYCDAVVDVVANVPQGTNTPNRLLQVPSSDGTSEIAQCTLECASGCDADHGECVLGVCRCDNGWRGNDCSENICPNGCGVHGKCEASGCSCKFGWQGADCSEPFSPSGTIRYDDKRTSGTTAGGAHYDKLSKGAVVYYTLEIEEEEEYTISTCFERTTLDTVLFLLNKKGTETLEFNDDDTNCKYNALNSKVTQTLSPGWYNIAVGGYDTEGDFVVDVKCANCLGLENCQKFEEKAEKKQCKKRNKKKIKEHEEKNTSVSRSRLLRGGG